MLRMGKPESDPQKVGGIFFMMRIRENALEETLKAFRTALCGRQTRRHVTCAPLLPP